MFDMKDEDTIKITEYMTHEEALDMLKSQKNDPISSGGFFYNMLKDAGPEVVEHMEKKASELISAGHNIGRAFSQANNDPEKKAMVMAELQRIAIKISKSANDIKKDDEN